MPSNAKFTAFIYIEYAISNIYYLISMSFIILLTFSMNEHETATTTKKLEKLRFLRNHCDRKKKNKVVTDSIRSWLFILTYWSHQNYYLYLSYNPIFNLYLSFIINTFSCCKEIASNVMLSTCVINWNQSINWIDWNFHFNDDDDKMIA